MDWLKIIFIAQVLSTFFMTGLIWQVQLNHYPSFSYIDLNQFKEFQTFHMSSISIIVMPMMFIELISALLLLSYQSFSHVSPIYLTNFLLIILVWFVTWKFSVPCHSELLERKSLQAIKRLVKTNWLRTIAWTVRSGLLVHLLFNESGVLK